MAGNTFKNILVSKFNLSIIPRSATGGPQNVEAWIAEKKIANQEF